MKQEASQELVSSERHELLLAAMSVVLPAKGDAIFVESDETMVGDGNAVSVTSQIVEDVFWPTERGLSVHDPVLMEELMEETAEAVPLREA
jgi:hypothetical protein